MKFLYLLAVLLKVIFTQQHVHGLLIPSQPAAPAAIKNGSNQQAQDSNGHEKHGNRRSFLDSVSLVAAFGIAASFGTNVASAIQSDEPDSTLIIRACTKPPNGSPPNCVSTSSVQQVDLYAAPWVWFDDTLSVEAVLARLKGAIVFDPTLTIVQQTTTGLVVEGKRNFALDRIVFRINPEDRAVTFQSSQIEGPESVRDFGANRQRLEQIRKRAQIFQVMGSEFASADSGRREGAVDQLKAIWGYTSGGGYESVLLDE